MSKFDEKLLSLRLLRPTMFMMPWQTPSMQKPNLYIIASPEMACERVKKRVSEGGHDIPVETIYRRYWLGLENLFRIFLPIVDYWAIYDNNFQPDLIADTDDIYDNLLFNQIKDQSCQRKKK